MSQTQFLFLPVTELDTKIRWCHTPEQHRLPINTLQRHYNKHSRYVCKIFPSDVSSNTFFPVIYAPRFPWTLLWEPSIMLWWEMVLWVSYRQRYGGSLNCNHLCGGGGGRGGKGATSKTNSERINILTMMTGKMLVIHREFHHHFVFIVEMINKVPIFS